MIASDLNTEYVNIQQYNYYVKLSRQIPQKTQIELTQQIESLLMNRDQWKEETKYILYEKFNTPLADDEIMKVYNFEKQFNHQAPQYINYHANKKLTHQILKTINKYPPSITSLDEFYKHIYTVTHTIYNIIQKSKVKNHKCYAAKIDRRISRLNNRIKNKEYANIRRMLHLKKGTSYVRIMEEAKGEIEYLRYIKNTMKAKIEISKAKAERIRTNAKLFRFGIRKRDTNQQNNNQENINHPSKEDTINFWNSIFQNGRLVDNMEPLINEFVHNNHINNTPTVITLSEVEEAIRYISNWKAPGNDLINGFWLKYIDVSKKFLTKLFNQWLDDPTTIPDEMLRGRTVLIHKGNEETDPKNYRPITCLNTSLKVFTSVIKNKILKQLNNNPKEKQLELNQLGCQKFSYASKEGLLESVLLQSYLNRKQKKYCELYIDVEKAYDSICHDWITTCLKYYNIPNKINKAVEHMMNNWTIKLHYNKDEVGDIRLKNGILQGDSFSPLLFVLSIDCISKKLNEHIPKITIPNGNASFTINHIYYMDDLKIIVETAEQMAQANKILLKISNAIGLKINDNKSGLLIKGKQQIPEELKVYPKVTDTNPYKYLGVELSDKVSKNNYISRVKKNIEKTLDTIMSKQLSTMNTIRQINSDVISKLRYASSVVPWRLGDLDQLDKLIRQKLYEHKVYSKMLPSARLYIKKEQLGLGLMSCRNEYTKELFRVLLKYRWESKSNLNDLIEVTNMAPEGIWKKLIRSCKKQITEKEIEKIINTREHEEKNRISKALTDIEEKFQDIYISKWKESKVQFYERVNSDDTIADPLIAAWRTLNIKRDAYLQILKMQEDAIFTGNRKAHILNKPIAKFCKYCTNTTCSISHILLGCPIAKKMQIRRHDNICKEIYYAIYKKHKQHDNTVWPSHIPKCTRFEKENITILYNKEVLPRSTGAYPKRPDVYVEFGQELAYIFDVAIVSDHKVRETYSQKVGKYQQLSQMLYQEKGIKKAMIIPVIISTSGLINKHSYQRLRELEINIKWAPIIRELIINQMKDIMFYLNQQTDNFEIEPVNSIGNNYLQTHAGDVSLDEVSNYPS